VLHVALLLPVRSRVRCYEQVPLRRRQVVNKPICRLVLISAALKFGGLQVWDPVVICKQIAALQFIFYGGLALLQLLFLGAFGSFALAASA
jgi:hypothetical protein